MTTTDVSPPAWADLILRASLKRRDVESVVGDLLEEYRESVVPARGVNGADAWYVRQALGFLWRSAAPYAALFALLFVSRTALDWRSPTTDFHTRATVTTLLSASVFLIVGWRTGARAGTFVGGAVGAFVTAALAVPLQAIGTVMLLLLWHDPATLDAIRGSGGIAEVFTLPIFVVVPAVVLGTVGGLCGAFVQARLSALRA